MNKSILPIIMGALVMGALANKDNSHPRLPKPLPTYICPNCKKVSNNTPFCSSKCCTEYKDNSKERNKFIQKQLRKANNV